MRLWQRPTELAPRGPLAALGSRRGTSLAAMLMALGLVCAFGAEPSDSRTPAPRGDLARSQSGQPRIREGTEIADQIGYFKLVGGRLVFFTGKDGQGFVGLENLNLERIARDVANHPEPLPWRVTGTVTEFRGNNFLLVERAILKSPGPPREDAVP